MPTGWEPTAGTKTPGTVAQQHADVAGDEVGGDDVEVAIAIEVAQCDVLRHGADRVRGLRAEAAKAVADEHADGVVVGIGGDDVEVAIVIDIAKRDGRRIVAGSEWRTGGERPIAGADGAR